MNINLSKNIVENLEEIHLSIEDFILMGYGYANNEIITSMIGTDKSGKKIRVITYSKNEKQFKETTYNIPEKIHFIIPVDVDHTGNLSFLLIFQDKKGFNVKCHHPHMQDAESDVVKLVDICECDQIPLIVAREDWNSCVLYQKEGKTYVYDILAEKHLDFGKDVFGKISSDHSSGFVDIDGDLKPELVLVEGTHKEKKIVIYTDSGSEFTKKESIDLSEFDNVGPIVFGDFDVSGGTDIAFVSEKNGKFALNVLLNKRKRIKDKSQNEKNFFDYTNHSKFTETSFEINNDLYHIKVDLSGVSSFKPLIRGDKAMTDISCGISVADINLDSYPDILLSGKIENKPFVLILENEYGRNKKNSLSFMHHKFPLKHEKSTINNIISVSIADVLNDDEEYLVINYEVDSKYHIKYVKNNASKDFYKISAMTRLHKANDKTQQHMVPGISYKYYIEEDNVTRIGNQYAQSSFLHLQTSSLAFGLGSVNFLIDRFFVGVPNTKGFSGIYEVKSKILPNSIVLFKPNNKGIVTVELYLRFSDYFMNILLVLLVVMVVNLVIVFYGYKKEVQKEKRNKRRETHLFNFSAL